MTMIKMTNLNLKGKRVLIRSDLNVPIKDGRVTSDARIVASMPTVRRCLDAGALVMLTSHLGRPTEGEYEEKYSLRPVVDYLDKALGDDVSCRLVKDYLDEGNALELRTGEVAVLENVRFNVGEKADDDALSAKYAALCDVFVMDAFGTAHRAQASTHGVAERAPTACAGPLLAGELEALGRAMSNPKRPMVAVVGGSKVSSKLTVLESLSKIADRLVVGGGIANTFLVAAGKKVGKSLHEPDLVDMARRIVERCDVPTPTDVVCAKDFDEKASATTKSVDDVEDDDMILDLGPESARTLADVIGDAETILWNGPVGVFEWKSFASGTKTIAEAVAASSGFSVAGGGDTLAAIDEFGVKNKVSYISTGGGAFLEFVEGKTLPAVAVLEERGDTCVSCNVI